MLKGVDLQVAEEVIQKNVVKQEAKSITDKIKESLKVQVKNHQMYDFERSYKAQNLKSTDLEEMVQNNLKRNSIKVDGFSTVKSKRYYTSLMSQQKNPRKFLVMPIMNKFEQRT